MKIAWRRLKQGMVAAFVLLLGLLGAGGRVIVDRRKMYGDDPTNDPYSPDFEGTHTRRR